MSEPTSSRNSFNRQREQECEALVEEMIDKGVEIARKNGQQVLLLERLAKFVRMSATTRKDAVSCREREKVYEEFLDKMIAMGIPLIVRRSILMMLESVNQDDLVEPVDRILSTREE